MYRGLHAGYAGVFYRSVAMSCLVCASLKTHLWSPFPWPVSHANLSFIPDGLRMLDLRQVLLTVNRTPFLKSSEFAELIVL